MKNHTGLKTNSLYKQYGKRWVVNDVSIEVRKGEIVGLLGPNGAGKTTTFYMITGMIKPSKGHILLGNEDITEFAMYKRSRLGIGYLSQEPSIFGKLTIEENLRLVLEMTAQKKDVREQIIEDLLDDLSIKHIRNSKGYNLSGGERRRVEICRTLALNPDFILLDEPFAGIDPIAVEDIQSIVHSLKNRDIGVLITDHNVRETLSITDRSYLLYEGRILKSGTSDELAGDKEVRRLYLGQRFQL
jgi:lipopolysaccharide export system ATP-binding protein